MGRGRDNTSDVKVIPSYKWNIVLEISSTGRPPTLLNRIKKSKSTAKKQIAVEKEAESLAEFISKDNDSELQTTEDGKSEEANDPKVRW